MNFSRRHVQAGSISLAVVLGATISLAPTAGASQTRPDAGRAAAVAALQTVVSATPASAPSGIALASGRLLDRSGAALGGTQVVLAVVPSNDSLARLQLGSGVPLRFLARTATSATGQWTLRPPDNLDLTGAVSKAGDVNFAVLAFGSGWSASTYFSAHSAVPTDRAATAGALSTARVGDRALTLDPGSSDLTMKVIGWNAAAGTAAALKDAALVTPATPGAPANPGCGLVFDHDYGSTAVVVGQSFSEAKDVTADFKYGRGQSSSLGVGVSTSGKAGSFSASGSVSVSTSSSEDFASITGAHNASYVTQFDWRRYAVVCTGVGKISYSARAEDWLGGARHRSASDIRAGYCVPQEAGSRAVINRTSARKLAAAAKTSGLIGINLSGRTGYSTTASLVYRMHAKGHPLCGEADYPMRSGHTPGRIQVHSSVVK